MFDNKVATKIARIWNPLQLCGNPFRAFRLNFIMVNCKNCMACSCNQTVYHPINYSSSDIFNILSRRKIGEGNGTRTFIYFKATLIGIEFVHKTLPI